MSTKLAVIDVDETLVDTKVRFSRARAAMVDLFNQHVNEGETKMKHVIKLAEEKFWEVAFTPGLIELDKPIPGAYEALDLIESAGYHVVLLSSRIEALREATLEWFWAHQRGIYDRLEYGRYLFLKPPAFQFVKTTVWKAGITQMLAAMYDVEVVLFVDDDEENRKAVLEGAGTYPVVKVAESIDAAVTLLYPHRKGDNQE